jgi:hypothetical protein
LVPPVGSIPTVNVSVVGSIVTLTERSESARVSPRSENELSGSGDRASELAIWH